jgi:hypothetical protein
MKDYALQYQEKLLMVVVVSTAAVLITMLLTKPSSPEQLRKFYEVIRPSGFWGPVRRPEDPAAENLGKQILSWGLAAMSLFAILFGLGEWMLGSTPVGIALSLGGTTGWLIALHLVGAFKEVESEDSV